jgi:pyruvate/2-oxoglutarate dehydrogenase complex dihydrolipoamide acyltransferase (E2) component
MRVPIELQQLGPDFTSGFIVDWLVAVGDAVVPGDELVEVETEKITVQMEALNAGVLVEIVHEAGEEVPVGTVIGYLETAG